MLLRHSLGLETEAASVEAAVESVLGSGARTVDLAGPGADTVSCSRMAALVSAAVA
jgi:3-isopropylmalate dehydrogenase